MENDFVLWEEQTRESQYKMGNISRRIFSPLLFVVALIPVTIILRTLKQGYSCGEGKERLNHLLFMDYFKLCGSSDNEIDSLVKVVKIMSGVIVMQSGSDKSAVLKMKR